ncbi:hypothetical protein [Streptomyces sp. NPDC089799]|uniref:hypothetical protein n=1 Tax=Streptomyces sp. NPDC089799 TaxID=3155066 RepID=UPI0034434599
MFEIRIICDPTDTGPITSALSRAFTTGPVRRLPSRTAGKERLYITADHRTVDSTMWPTPEDAYAKAPSVISEIGWTARHVRHGLDSADPREARVFWLRKAALLDRIALADGHHDTDGDALHAAIEAAHRLRVFDTHHPGLHHGDPDADDAFLSPRGYLRQQYAHWANNQ